MPLNGTMHPNPTLPPANSTAFSTLKSMCDRLKFTKHDVTRRLDDRVRYLFPKDNDFPFRIDLHHFKADDFNSFIRSWHEQLELIFTLDQPARMVMGEETIELGRGDILIVDNLKLHSFENIHGLDTRVVSIKFMSEFIYTPGSPSCDYTFLLPFSNRREGAPYVLRATDELAPSTFKALAEIIRSYFNPEVGPHWKSASKLSLMKLLYHLTCKFQNSEVLKSDFIQRRQQTKQLTGLFEYIQRHYDERITVDDAAKMVHMSSSQFMKAFRKVTGMTFVAYVTRVRLGYAYRLLRETDKTIAEIASSTGFSDQSYFDRRFKKAFNKSPSQFRKDLVNEV